MSQRPRAPEVTAIGARLGHWTVLGPGHMDGFVHVRCSCGRTCMRNVGALIHQAKRNIDAPRCAICARQQRRKRCGKHVASVTVLRVERR